MPIKSNSRRHVVLQRLTHTYKASLFKTQTLGFFSTVPMATNSEEDKASKTKKEGASLLGAPSFTKLDNGRFKCVETGHEMLAKDKDSYSNSKRCRLGLIDFALSKNKPPLNIFKQDPLSRYQKVPISLSLSLSPCCYFEPLNWKLLSFSLF